MSNQSNATRSQTPEAVTGVQLAQGIGHLPTQGFWAEAWGQVLKRPGAILGLTWVAIVAFFAIFAPFIASGHPFIVRTLDAQRGVVSTQFPLFAQLTATDILLVIGTFAAIPWFVLRLRTSMSERLGTAIMLSVQSGIAVVLAAIVRAVVTGRDVSDTTRQLEQAAWFGSAVASVAAAIAALCVFWLVPLRTMTARIGAVSITAVVLGVVIGGTWTVPLEQFDYRQLQAAGGVQTVHTLIPFSPNEGTTDRDLAPPLTTLAAQVGPEEAALFAKSDDRFLLGTDSLGQDVLSQMMHACRLSISIGLVSTAISVVIGVTVGALMGYFGGWVDLLLYRVVEIFMAVPVLFLLIVAAAVLPRNTYVMMAIIGCVAWTGSARFVRAEFFKLRNQDFVQSARAVGLPLRSILFKHMLPNGVTPVLVDASFAIAAAILAEAVLSFLGLGPANQASWGRLLSEATNQVGDFKPWLAIFPGLAIFLTVLSYNLIGEAFRDAIDPKLKKARV
jgi:peptide/nickel transport system permease protein